MDASRQGEAGVLAWCNSIRFNMAKDPGRQFLEDQIQNSLDFLDNYLDNVLSGPKTEYVTELLKTPGRRKNAPARTRAATAAASKVQAVISMSLEEADVEEENLAPVNSFHKALLQAKETGKDAKSITIPPVSPQHLAGPKLVAESADKPSTLKMLRNDEEIEMLMHDTTQQDAPEARTEVMVKELSMIAEDDESGERSRMSVELSHPGRQANPVQASQPAIDGTTNMDVDESVQQDMTSTSTNTFHSIPLDSPQPLQSQPRSEFPSEVHLTEPLPRITRVSVSHDDVHAMTAPLPIVPSGVVDELSVPLRDGPTASASAPSLASKPSLSQLGLPAPSPLYKSTRIAREPSMGAALGAGPGAGGKRSSWLVKAREMKAMEDTAKKTSSALNAAGTKRKSGELLSGPSAPGTGAIAAFMKSAEEEQRALKVPKLVDHRNDDSGMSWQGNQPTADEPPAQRKDVSANASAESQAQARPASPPQHSSTLIPSTTSENFIVPVRSSDEDKGVLDRFKRTVEGFGARTGKSMGKSLGGNAAAALAEARAAAEARVAERNKLGQGDEATSPESKASEAPRSTQGTVDSPADAPSQPSAPDESERRLSVSDLVSTSEKKASQQGERPLPPLPSLVPAMPPKPAAHVADVSTSTTPPHSPPPVRRPLPAMPVFSKPPAVFHPPPAPSGSQPSRTDATAGSSKEFSFKLPTANTFSLPAAMTLGVPTSLPSSSSQKQGVPLSAQSSKVSMFSDAIFDKEDDIPAWMPRTQDTDFSIQPSQSQTKGSSHTSDFDDDDDSWHVDEKFTSNQMWTPFGFASADKDDTWSTLPSRSTSHKGGDTGPVMPTQTFATALSQSMEHEQSESQPANEGQPARAAPDAFDFNVNSPEPEEVDIADVAMEIDPAEDIVESDLDDMYDAGKTNASLAPSKPELERARSQSQQSMASTTSSSQSQAGFFSQASKLVNSVLGGSKKTKPEVKSLQLAAQAAKKQQEELERKATRLKEMENRRQLAMQRKAEEDKARALEEDRKIKEDNEKRKREREEHTDKRPLRNVPKKPEDNDTKKRKLVAETEKKVEAKKPPSKDKKDNPSAPRVGKPGPSTAPGLAIKTGSPPKSALKQPASSTSTAPTAESMKPGITAPKTIRPVASTSNLKSAAKGKAPAVPQDDDESQPAQVVQSQMATRAKAQMQAAQAQPPVTSESIELPDINSEYSDSEDEDRPRTFDPPEWAQSPELRHALQQQSTMNPDDIFGRIGPLRMEEIFRTRQSRFRARTSSANWSGTDQLTADEEREYARRMGFK